VNFVYIRGVFIVYCENVIDISEIAYDIVFREYLSDFGML
jgi:hypothetical protein